MVFNIERAYSNRKMNTGTFVRLNTMMNQTTNQSHLIKSINLTNQFMRRNPIMVKFKNHKNHKSHMLKDHLLLRNPKFLLLKNHI